MKNHKILLALVVSLFISVVMFGQTIPQEINYQGVLKDGSGVVVPNGDYNLTFKLYDVPSGGSELWMETKLISVVDGIINTQFGSVTPIALPFDTEYWLGVTVASESEMAPRVKLSSVPYSYMSMNVPDGIITAAKIADGQVVKSINGLKDSVTLVAGSNISLTPSGNDIMISSSAAGDDWGTQTVITDGTLSGEGTVSLPLKLSQQSAATGQVLKWSGSTWQPGNDLTGTSLWQLNGNNVYYNAGNVGVGLSNPIGMLEIYGNSVDAYPHLLLSEADGFSRISFRTMLASSKHWVLAGHTNATDTVSQFHLNYNDGTVGKNIFSVYGNSNVTIDGKVGIGTTSPRTHLQLHSNTTYTYGITPILRISDNFKEWNIGLGYSGDRFSIASEDYTERLTIKKSNGNVGIGTDDPVYKLDVVGPLNLNKGSSGAALRCNGAEALWYDGTYFSWGFGGAYNYFADQVGIGTSAPEHKLHVVNSSLSYTIWGQKSGSTGGVGVRGDNDATTGSGISGNSSNYHGVYGSTERTDNNYGVYTPDNLYSLNYHLSGAIMQLVRNNGQEVLEPGDVVVLSGIEQNFNKLQTVLVEKSKPDKNFAVFGVVHSFYPEELLSGNADATGVKIEPKNSEFIQQNDYLLVVVFGPAKVKTDVSVKMMRPGQLVTVSETPGYAGNLNHSQGDKTLSAFQGTILGKVLNPIDNENNEFSTIYVTLK